MKGMPAVATAPIIRREIGDDHICTLIFDRPESGANIFDAVTLDELNEHLDFVEKDASLRGLIVASAKKSIFVAGADLKTLFQHAQTGGMRAFIAKGQQVFNRLAGLKIPTVAAIHGASAGGGYEVALSCDYRVATDDAATRIGLPETTLGLIPAWGGCTRLPRAIGAEKAAEVILKGKLYSAQEALKLGLVDEISPRDQLLDRARKKLGQGKRKMEGRAPASPASQELRPSNLKSATRRLCTYAAAVVIIFTLPVNGWLIFSAFKPRTRPPHALATLYQQLEAFRIVDGYGLFRVMTKDRCEIVLEGSADGVDWLPYEFKWKPGDVKRVPGWCAPHQPRLDWQMWFAALGTPRENPWLVALIFRLLQGSHEVNGLLANNPFPDKPPRYIRAMFYRYRFTTVDERHQAGAWWKREELREYLPTVSLEQFR